NIGSSPNSIDETYRGPNPFSEPETQAIREFVNNRHITISLYFHSYSNLCLYPPGYDLYQPPSLEVFKALSRRFTSHNGYIVGTPWEVIYRVNGSSDDWLFYTDEHDPIFAFTIEVGTQEDFFWPPLNRVEPLVRENIPTCLAAAEFSDNPRRSLPPHIAFDVSARQFGERRVRVTWRPPNDQDNPPLFYKVKVLSDPIRVWADFEEEDPEWQAVNFSLTSAQSHQGRFSFSLRPSANLATLTYSKESPLPDTIRAWMMWDLRTNLRHGVALEVSTDGLTWHPLSGTHTRDLIVNEINLGPVVSGSSNNSWRLVSWATEEWRGRMGQIRFRYYRLGSHRMTEHCYIDQVGPLNAWDWEALIADSVSDPILIDTLRGENIWYSVQVVDREEDLSFWSLPVPIEEPLPSIQWELGVGWNLIGIPLNLSPDGWNVLTPLWER
ncbi:MAG: M14 family zinc carboxypeptidase, partial [bacterium]